MRSVPGEHFKFVLNPDASAFVAASYNVGLAYPANRYVNDIGLDVYDQSSVTPLTPANAWNRTVLPSLTAAESFADAHGRPIAVTEWGAATRTDGHGLGDDPLYVNNMIAWMRDPGNQIAYETYFDYDGRGTNSIITGGRFPRSLEAFRSAFTRTKVATGSGSRGTSDAWFVLAAAVVLAGGVGGIGWRWTRRPRRHRRVESLPRRIYPPTQDVVPTLVRQWAEQSSR